jgi:cell division septum initiation protein DivIVA
VRVIPGKLAREAAVAQQEAEESRKAAAQHDRTLLATYLSVSDIERLRDQRLELLVQQAHVTEQYVVNLKERESRLTDVVRRYRPYSESPRAPVLPDHGAEDIVNTVNGLQVYEQELAKNTAEQQKLRTAFNSDIARFKQLKGIN